MTPPVATPAVAAPLPLNALVVHDAGLRPARDIDAFEDTAELTFQLEMRGGSMHGAFTVDGPQLAKVGARITCEVMQYSAALLGLAAQDVCHGLRQSLMGALPQVTLARLPWPLRRFLPTG